MKENGKTLQITKKHNHTHVKSPDVPFQVNSKIMQAKITPITLVSTISHNGKAPNFYRQPSISEMKT